VIGRVLRLVCGYASIVPVRSFRDTEGRAEIDDPWTTVNEWTYPEMWDQTDPDFPRHKVRVAFRGTIIALMAGAEAVRLIGGHPDDYGDDYDREEIELLAASPEAELSKWVQQEPRMRRQTRRLVRNHECSIDTVALHLMECEVLSGKEIDRILERQFRGVRVRRLANGARRKLS
jgi:hypothetical protein